MDIKSKIRIWFKEYVLHASYYNDKFAKMDEYMLKDFGFKVKIRQCKDNQGFKLFNVYKRKVIY